MIDPELQPFLDAWEKAWSVLPSRATPQDRRALFERIAEAVRGPMPEGVETFVRFVETDRRNVLVRVFRDRTAGEQPCLVYMHGGAWMQGSPETHWDIAATIAAANRQTVISVDYALAPEHPFPAAVNECRAVVEWAFDNAGALGIDHKRIAVGGDSAGGNLAAAMPLAFRGTRFDLKAQLLVYPAVDFDMSTPSFVENADGPIITTAGMPAVNAMYCPDPEQRHNPLAAPLHAADHSGLPPAFVAVAEHDPLRDDGRAYAEKLRASGVPCVLDEGEGLIHGYLRAITHSSAARRKLSDMCAWLADINGSAAAPV